MAVVDDVDAVRERQRRREILLDQHDGLAGGRELAAGLHQIAHDDRREPLERLVQQDDLRIADQRAGDREHLLLAARQVGAAAAAALLAAAGTSRRCGRAASVRRAVSPARTRFSSTSRLPKMRRSSCTSCMPARAMVWLLRAGDLDAVEHHRAGARRHHAHQALQRRALAGAVAAEQRHHLVALDAQRDVEQDVGVAVVAVQAVDLEQAHAAISPCTPPR